MATWWRSGVCVDRCRFLVGFRVYNKPPPMAPYSDKTPESDPFDSAVKFSVIMNRFAFLFGGLSALCVGVKPFLR
jgi:hypothetical protein